MTKGAFFHSFASKDALGVAAASRPRTASALFATAPYHARRNPLDRVLAYIAFRRAIITGDVAAFTCLAGTLVQEVHASSGTIRAACGRAILATPRRWSRTSRRRGGRAASPATGRASESLARHTQAVLQGAFILAKAADEPEVAREASITWTGTSGTCSVSPRRDLDEPEADPEKSGPDHPRGDA